MPAAVAKKLTIEATVRARGRTSGTRVLPTGWCRELDNGRWAPLTRLRAPVMRELASAVAASGFFDLPAVIDNGNLRDGSILEWTVELDGRSHTVEYRHGGGAIAEPVLAALDAHVQRVIGEALDAESE
jgi:hypothetical protein